MSDQKHEYTPVPVDAAAYIAKHCHKDVVIVVSVDNLHEQMHCTTFGKHAQDKLLAAEWGDFIVAKLHGGEAPPRRTFEDFRLDAAKVKEQRDALLAAAKRAVVEMQDSTCIYPACQCAGCQLAAAISKAEGQS